MDLTISCIIPTLGRGEVLCKTIRMLLEQSSPAHEIIVVDQTVSHGSNTQENLQSLADEKHIIWLRQSEPNASKARNAGALAATGNVLLFLDDDVQIGSDFLANYHETFVQRGAVGVSGAILEGEGKLVDRVDPRVSSTELGWLLHFPKNYATECETSFMMSGNVAIQRDIFLSIGGMDENYDRGAHREESDFAMRFRRAGYRFWYNPRCKVFHLGPSIVPLGGARHWQGKRRFGYFHHCVGDWYFNLGFWTATTAMPLLARSLRHFVLTRQNLAHPWYVPIALAYWLAGLPFAASKRWAGPRLLSSSVSGLWPQDCRNDSAFLADTVK